MKVLINNDTVNNIEQIFHYVNELKYEEAYELVISNTYTTIVDPLIKEWVKALYDFFECKKHKEAIKLLEYIKPFKIKSDMDFRIYNTLSIFYIDIKDCENFKKIKKDMELSLDTVNNNLLKLKAYYNIANGLYVSKEYRKAIEYADRCIEESKKAKLIANNFAFALAVKSICLYKLNERKEAYKAKKEYEFYKYLTEDFDYDLKNECRIE